MKKILQKSIIVLLGILVLMSSTTLMFAETNKPSATLSSYEIMQLSSDFLLDTAWATYQINQDDCGVIIIEFFNEDGGHAAVGIFAQITEETLVQPFSQPPHEFNDVRYVTELLFSGPLPGFWATMRVTHTIAVQSGRLWFTRIWIEPAQTAWPVRVFDAGRGTAIHNRHQSWFSFQALHSPHVAYRYYWEVDPWGLHNTWRGRTPVLRT